MKKNILLYAAAACLLFGCNEDSFLKENPKDFMSSSNSFETKTDFNMSIHGLYSFTRAEFFGYDESKPFDYIYGTDLIFDGEPGTYDRHGNMLAAYNPISWIVKIHWDNLYKIVSEANTIISRVNATNLPEDFKNNIVAKSCFFRGLAYRTLAYLYGGVPIEVNEVSDPKTDYVRASREETLKQALNDIKFAAENLSDITEVRDGEISKPAAYHLLSEIYLALNMNSEAVDAATKVINNPALGLMKHRFGSRSTENPGDVYWDLFRKNNQNRSAGNTEGIWVIQFENDLPGGGSSTTELKSYGNYMLERNCVPYTGQCQIEVDGKRYAAFPYWPCGDYTGGRGIGWGPSTKYFTNVIWEDDFYGDMRNSENNFVRKFKVSNKDLIAKGITEIDVENPPAGFHYEIPCRCMYAYQSKCTTPFNHPDELYTDKKTYRLKSLAGTTYVDQYMFRLAETYLLRAEAFLKLGNKEEALADINVIRDRAHAKFATIDQLDMEYILDERMRELGVEEKRRLTLMRTGLLYDRVMKCNPYYANPETNGDGVGMQKHYNLWPIPQSAIEANVGAQLEQNPGYE